MSGAPVEEPSFLIDYDVLRWVRIPRDPVVVDVRKWARQAADAWARDTHHEGDRRWTDLLAQIFDRAAAARLTDEPDALFLHVLAPVGGPPSVQMVNVRFLPTETDLETSAQELVASSSVGAVEQPTEEAIALSSGRPARVVTSHQVQEDGSILTNLNVLWEPVVGMLGIIGGGTYHTGRLLAAREDIVALAGVTQLLQPGDAVPGRAVPRDGQAPR